MTRSCCEITDNAFSETEARSDLKNYSKKGPARQTRLILDAVRSAGLKDVRLLDIGGGIGAIHHELLEDVAREATHVDASSAYLKEARVETERRGHSPRVNFVHADFKDVADEVPDAEIVTLDRVVCCYPDFRGLLTAAATHSRGILALTYPRETWYLKLALGVINFFQRLVRDPFRVFVHPVAEMDALVRGQGFERIAHRRLFIWEMAAYQRAAG